MGLSYHKTLIIIGIGKEIVKGIHKQATKVLLEKEFEHLITTIHGGMNGIFSFAILK